MSDFRAEVIFCDDVRQEANGKHILIGVYSGDLIPGAAFPNVIQLSIWVRVRGLASGVHDFSFKLLDPQDAVSFTIDDHVLADPSSSDVTLFAFGSLPVRLEQQGAIRLMFSIDHAPEIELDRLVVRKPPENDVSE